MKAVDSGRIRSCVGLAVLVVLTVAGDAAAGGLVPRSLGPTTSTVVTIEKTYAAGTIVVVSANRTLDRASFGDDEIQR
ncbi:hypothetical protein ACCT25_16930, partial [Rhizobium ruizarguesonis]